MRWGVIIWCLLFFAPLVVMLVLDGFCSGKELCHAGLMFTLLVYAGGIVVTLISILMARLMFRALHAGQRTRIITLKLLLLIPLVPGLIVSILLIAGSLGRLG